jgi:hypothetical protein
MDGVLSIAVFAASFYLMMRFGCGAHMTRGTSTSRAASRPRPGRESQVTDVKDLYQRLPRSTNDL